LANGRGNLERAQQPAARALAGIEPVEYFVAEANRAAVDRHVCR
jgi:hypothetical protein